MDRMNGYLDYQVSMAGSPGDERSKHMWVKLRKIPFLPSLNFQFPGTGRDFRCDYASRDEHQTPLASCPFAQYYHVVPRGAAVSGGSFQHCYNLDLKTGLVLEWDLDLHQSLIKVQISAWSNVSDYVAIGFRPLGGSSSKLAREAKTGREMRFGMAGADIVLGHVTGIQQLTSSVVKLYLFFVGWFSHLKTKKPNSLNLFLCFSARETDKKRQYYASKYSGMPEPDTSLQISGAFSESKNERLYLQFQRPLVGGRLARSGINASIVSNVSDMMWAIGKWDDEAAVPRYHNIFRGWREVNWTDPEFDARPLLSLRPYKCLQENGLVYP